MNLSDSDIRERLTQDLPEGAIGVVDTWKNNGQTVVSYVPAVGYFEALPVGDEPGYVRVEKDPESGVEYIYLNGENSEDVS